jgi:hypothetical protein
MKNKILQLSQEEIDAGVTLTEAPISEFISEDTSDKNIERMARGFILGSQVMGKRREIRETLESKVVQRIGRKGKYLTDKLFELIEGISIVEKNKDGRDGKTLRHYTIPPNLNAIIYAIDRVLGKPTQHTEHVEERRGIMVIEAIIKNLAEGKNEDKQRSETAGSVDGARIIDVRSSEVVISQ